MFLLQEHCFSFLFQCSCCSLSLPSALQYFLSDVCVSFNFIHSPSFCPSLFRSFITHFFSLLNFCCSLNCFRFMCCQFISIKWKVYISNISLSLLMYNYITPNMRSADQGPQPLPTSNMRSADQGPRPLPTSNMRSADQGPRPLPTSNMRSADQGPRPLPTSNMRSADQRPWAPAYVQHEVSRSGTVGPCLRPT